MKRIVILIVLVTIAGVAGVVVRSSKCSVGELRGLVSHNNAGDVREEIRQSYALSPGARVELAGLNGAVKIETSDSKTAEVFIERTAASQEALDRRRVIVEADANSLRIHGEKSDGSFFSRLFGSSAGERVTLKLPRQIALYAKGVNGAFVTSDIDGAVEVSGVNGRMQIGGAVGRAVAGPPPRCRSVLAELALVDWTARRVRRRTEKTRGSVARLNGNRPPVARWPRDCARPRLV